MPVKFPSPDTRNPISLADGAVHFGTVFLKAVIDHPQFEVGNYTYASAHEPPDDWAVRLAPYLYPFSPEKLVIGKFCQIADGVTFVTSSANHRYDGFSSYPFAIFNGGDSDRPSLPRAGADTVIGHDVWFGTGATVLPGATIGNGVILGAGTVVGGVIPSYSVVAGNPGRVVRQRFDQRTIEFLERIAWWHWDITDILAHEAAICGGDVDALAQVAADIANRSQEDGN